MDKNKESVNMFYSESDLKNIISKREMDSVEIEHISTFDQEITVAVGGGYWKVYDLDGFVKYVFPNRDDLVIRTTDYGIFVWRKDGLK